MKPALLVATSGLGPGALGRAHPPAPARPHRSSRPIAKGDLRRTDARLSTTSTTCSSGSRGRRRSTGCRRCASSSRSAPASITSSRCRACPTCRSCRIVDPRPHRADDGIRRLAGARPSPPRRRSTAGSSASDIWRELEQPAARARHASASWGLASWDASAAEALLRLGFPVRGWSRTPKSDRRASRRLPGADGLDAFLAGTDILVSLLPLTPETRGTHRHAAPAESCGATGRSAARSSSMPDAAARRSRPTSSTALRDGTLAGGEPRRLRGGAAAGRKPALGFRERRRSRRMSRRFPTRRRSPPRSPGRSRRSSAASRSGTASTENAVIERPDHRGVQRQDRVAAIVRDGAKIHASPGPSRRAPSGSAAGRSRRCRPRRCGCGVSVRDAPAMISGSTPSPSIFIRSMTGRRTMNGSWSSGQASTSAVARIRLAVLDQRAFRGVERAVQAKVRRAPSRARRDRSARREATPCSSPGRRRPADPARTR